MDAAPQIITPCDEPEPLPESPGFDAEDLRNSLTGWISLILVACFQSTVINSERSDGRLCRNGEGY